MKTLILFFLPFFLFAQIDAKVSPTSSSSIQGDWLNTDFGFDMKLSLKAGGKGVFDEEAISYTINGKQLIIKSPSGNVTYSFIMAVNTLTLSGGDLDQAITFKRSATVAPIQASDKVPLSSKTVVNDNSKLEKLLGQWTTDRADLEFKSDGKGQYNGNPFTYTLNGNTLTSGDLSGESQFVVMFLGKSMTLMGSGVNATFVRGHAGYKAETSPAGQNASTNSNGGGTADQSIVGKWCYVSSLTNPNASSSSSRCININANGTYAYQSESSISGYGGGYYGGSNSQNADSGTWKLSGNRIYVNSRSQGNKVYSFEKRNHPKNGDPMIIIDGDPYVTYYQRSPW